MIEDISIIPNILLYMCSIPGVLCCSSSECCCFRMQILGQPTATWKDTICSAVRVWHAPALVPGLVELTIRYFYHVLDRIRVALLRRGQRC